MKKEIEYDGCFFIENKKINYKVRDETKTFQSKTKFMRYMDFYIEDTHVGWGTAYGGENGVFYVTPEIAKKSYEDAIGKK